MKRSLLLVTPLLSFYLIQAQPAIKDRKYPSLLWEITGNGLKKPSYLIGTMHVSNKLVFHLPDSFYIALRKAQVVALETNPETWQEDMSKYDVSKEDYSAVNRYGTYTSMPNDYLNINTLKFFKYDNKIQRSLYSNPSTINNLLYRNYGDQSGDFEEDTYLDMYIYQCGKKWGKKVAGVENYGESMKLMAEAYRDEAKDKTKKERSYDDGSDEYSSDRLQEAYRNGNLDLLDSINKFNSVSDAFDEKFLYKRNEVQARSMDSIMRTGNSLFVGVGAAHLPGNRGVIELLRKKGYKLRPVRMGERDSKDKEQVEKLRVPVIFRAETADDGLFKVDIPGKFYKLGDDAALDQKQYADMANGSYYMVTRIMTNAWLWSHSTEEVYQTIDSLLYENIPGKIISKTPIIKNGYKGFDITNRTRRGDLQRYNIFVTPFEIIFFKMSGNGDYVEGDEAKRFFGSIQFAEYKSSTDWKKYTPAYGGFAVDLPHEPYIGNDGSWIYDAEDKSAGTQYRVVRSDIHNYHFAEEDSFDLDLMDESFKASEFIDTEFARKLINFKGYPALDGEYKDKKGLIYLTRFIIQGPHYYTLIAHGKQETAAMHAFLNSFEISPFVYGEPKLQKDTTLYFTVFTPVYPVEKKIKLNVAGSHYADADDDDDESEDDLLQGGAYRNRTISNDSTGEKIYISFFRSSRYHYLKDSLVLEKSNVTSLLGDTSWIIRSSSKSELPGKMKVWETVVTDTGSSRTLRIKTWYKEGIGFSLVTESDTLTKPSAFIKEFYESFTPAATLKGINPFEKKSSLFFSDLSSGDSILHKRAVRHIDDIDLDASDLPQLKNAIARLNWNEKKYLDTKRSLIDKLGDIQTDAAADYMKELYYALDDTVQLQYTVLENLLQQETSYAYGLFRDIVNLEPPVLDKDAFGFTTSSAVQLPGIYRKIYGSDNESFLDELSDSLQLTHTILPDLLPLLNLDDYKISIMRLLKNMIDSNLVKPNEYEQYVSKFLIEAKQELKKQSIAEKKKAIAKAEESKVERKISSFDDDEKKDSGNDDLSLYASLLLPLWETNTAVQTLIRQMLGSNDKQLKYNTLLLLLSNNKPYPDTLLNFFAGLDDYRYQLYKDLKSVKKPDRFPALYNNHLDLGKSALLDKKEYGKPDTVVYADRLLTQYRGKKGFVYFYKYKNKKDDLTWKLATVGLVPENPREFEFEDSLHSPFSLLSSIYFGSSSHKTYDFTGFTDTKIKEGEPLEEQLRNLLRKMIYSRRKSAKEFYGDDNERTALTDYVD